MRGLNKVTLIGSIAKDVEIQQLEGGISVARFLLTTTETLNDNKGGKQVNIEQHTIVLRKELAELAHKYLQKGSLIFLEGKLKTHQIDDTEGQTRYITEIMGEHLVVLDKGKAIYMDEWRTYN
ncbi:single-stranded DNA-binding protein [Spirosoma horti]